MVIFHYNKNKQVQCPTAWEECSTQQVLALIRLLHEGRTEDDVLLRAWYILSGVSKWHFAYLPIDVHHAAVAYCKWIFTNNLTTQKLPSYKTWWGKRLYGPCSNFEDLLMVEFHYAEVAYKNFIDTKEVKYLNELVAILYRLPNATHDFKKYPTADPRIPFSHLDIPHHMLQVQRWPLHVRQAVLYWYDANRQLLVDSYPTVYPEKPSMSQNLYDGLYGMMRALAGGKFGSFKEVEHMYVHHAHLELTYMNNDAIAMAENNTP